MQNILIVGATGLVGQALLQQLLAAPETGVIYAPTRTALPPHPKVINPLGSDLRQVLNTLTEPVDTAFCCLGTIRRKAGSQNAFHFADYVLPLYAGLTALHLQARHYLALSVLGANGRSSFFYSRTKGEMEQALKAQRWLQLTILRPSLLLGQRAEKRWLESTIAPLFTCLPQKWCSITAETVARAMVYYALHNTTGESVRIIESGEMQQHAGMPALQG